MQDSKKNPDEADSGVEKKPQAPLSGLLEEGNQSPAIALRGPQRREWIRCMISPAYFIDLHCTIEDKVKRGWVAFRLWLAQYHTLCKVMSNHQVIILKARQLGLTSLMTCYALWKMIFRPGCGILLFSRRHDEATELLDRIRGVHNRLPGFLQQVVTTDNARELSFGDQDSWAKAFSTTRHSGRSYTATLAIIDEADFIPLLKQLLNAVKPTIDAGGKLIMLSTIDKENRNSEFKRIWNQAIKGLNNYIPIFLPWTARPDRDEKWYQKQKEDYEEDDLYQEYPASPEEALSPRKSSKRFDPKWIAKCRSGREKEHTIIPIPGFTIFQPPQRGRRYLLAADPAEGNPSSDPSAGSVLDCESWEQVATIHGRFEPDIFANYLVQIAKHYNGAKICWERNNHGHAVEIAIRYQNYSNIYISPFDKKPGWLSNAKNKVLAVDYCAQILREGSCRLNDEVTIEELAMFEASNLRAPEGENDDMAMTIIIGLAALRWKSFEEEKGKGESETIQAKDVIEDLEF
jgi:hypothetical protein